MAVAKELLDILVCPMDRKSLRLEGDRLVCAECGRRYPVVDNIPVMLIEEAELPGQQNPAAPAKAQ
jgi:uncharacterized protein YbaR (Trm112 family)